MTAEPNNPISRGLGYPPRGATSHRLLGSLHCHVLLNSKSPESKRSHQSGTLAPSLLQMAGTTLDLRDEQDNMESSIQNLELLSP